MRENSDNHAEIARFIVKHPSEVLGIMQGILSSKSLVTLSLDDESSFLVTAIEAVNAEKGWVYLGYGHNEKQNALLLARSPIHIVTLQNKVKIEFTVPQLERAEINGRTAFRINLPKEVVRYQRREYFRAHTSLANPVTCLILSPGGSIRTRVLDVSLGGIGVLAYEGSAPLRSGADYEGCQLNLPGSGQFLVNLNIRSTYNTPLNNGSVSHRAGCQFINLPPSIETEIQRYILRVERERRNHSF